MVLLAKNLPFLHILEMRCSRFLFVEQKDDLIEKRGIEMNKLDKVIKGIQPLDDKIQEDAKGYVDFLAKPLGSLGKLEKIAMQLWSIYGQLNYDISKKCTIVMAADNGVYEEGIASSPQNVTVLQVINMLKGRAGINVLSTEAGADVKVVDIGVLGEFQDHKRLYKEKIAQGTKNLRAEWAMTREEAIKAIEVGIKLTGEFVEEGYQVFGTGEMGIGNTTTSAAVYMALTGCGADEAVGKGAGLTDKGLELKKEIISEAIDRHQPNPEDPIDVLAKVGGLDIAGLVGCFLSGAYHKRPIVIDGVISAAAAFVACRIQPLVKNYLIPSHCSMEPAYIKIMESLGLEPMLLMDMRLGEGSGCPLAFKMMDSATGMLRHMATFDDISLDTDYLIDLREEIS